MNPPQTVAIYDDYSGLAKRIPINLNLHGLGLLTMQECRARCLSRCGWRHLSLKANIKSEKVPNAHLKKL